MALQDTGGNPAGASTAEGAAGSSQLHEDNAHVEESQAGSSQADVRPVGDDDDDDLVISDEDYADTPFHEHPRFKALTSKTKKLARQNARLRETNGRYKGVDLDALRNRAQLSEQLEGLFQRNPTLHKQVLNAFAGTDEPTSRQPAEPEFDPKSLPFDVSDEVGQYFVKQHQLIDRLTKQLDGLSQERTQERTRSAVKTYENTWRSASESAAAALPEQFRDVFQDAMYGAYRVSLAEGNRVNPQEFVTKYLGKMKAKGLITGQSAARVAAAAQQRIAENNKQLPRQPAGGGTPASTKRTGETVADVNRRLRNNMRLA